MVRTWFTYNPEQEEGVGTETCRNSDMACKLRAIVSKEAGFKEKLIQVEGDTFLILRFWSVRNLTGS